MPEDTVEMEHLDCDGNGCAGCNWRGVIDVPK